MNNKHHRKRKYFSQGINRLRLLLTVIFIFILVLNIYFFVPNKSQSTSLISKEYFNLRGDQPGLHTSDSEWSKSTHNVQWIQNSDFNTSNNWVSEIIGDYKDVGTDISMGEAHYAIKGDQEIDYNIISGTINNSLTSPGWSNSTNPRIPVYPRRIATEPLHEITSDGCWTAHIWNESLGSELNPFQKVSVQWDKNISLPDDMSDYFITSASIKTTVNATVRAYKGYGQDRPTVAPFDPWGGLEVSGDINFSKVPPSDDGRDTYYGEGDYVIFYVELSNLNKSINYRVSSYKPSGLGSDVGHYLYDNITDTIFEPDNMENLIFYINQVLEGDHHNFTITIGIEINCEDNKECDWDIFEDIFIKTCDFNISFVKKIDQLTSASWKYQGEKLESDKGIIEVTESKLNFDFKINQSWPTHLSPNSEIKILINKQEHAETIKLSNADTFFKSIKEDGFDVTKLIPVNEDINVSIQIFLADEFGLAEEYVIAIDNVILNISYNLYIKLEKSILFEMLLTLAIIASGCLGGYFILYQRVLKYPKPVRKTRKFRFSLKKEKRPDVAIISRESAFKSLYNKELEKTASIRVRTPKPSQISSKMTQKSFNKSNKVKLSKKTLIILFILIVGVLLIPILHNLNLSNRYLEREREINHLNISSGPWSRELHIEQWINNPDFNSTDNWISEYEGDLSDINAIISDDIANFELLGQSGYQQWIEDDPLSGEWKEIDNVDGIPIPEEHQMTENGWYVSHQYVDNNLNQSVKVQWQKNFTTDVDMSDYYITSASLEAWINGTAQAMEAHNGGIDRPGDTAGSGTIRIATGDFARYFVLLSDLNHEREFEATSYQTTDLGRDGPPAITELNDTRITPINEESLIFYLNQAFEKDSWHFAITLGISIWCEDSVYATDRDFWNGLWIKNLTISFTYEKKMDQFTSAAWKYLGEQIEADNYSIEVTQARLYFDYKINQTWPTALSPNSEIKILINDQVYNETVKLINAETFFKAIKEEGMDVTKLIPNDEKINVSIQIYLADEFGLGYKLKLSIDNVNLWISYNVLIPLEENILFLVLFVVACIGAACLTTYIVLYQRIFKYPKAVRKVRKFRRTLRKDKSPIIPIISRERAFKGVYGRELSKTTNFLKIKPIEQELILDKLSDKTLEQKSRSTLGGKLESDQLIQKSLEKKEELDNLIRNSSKKD